MSTAYQRLLNLIECLQTKIEEFSNIRINDKDFSNIPAKYQIMELEKHLEIELKDLSELFSIGRNASLVLASLLMIYYVVKDIQTVQVISAEDLTYGICIEPSSIFELNEGISELENKKMVLLNDLDNPKSFLNSNKSFELTQSFVNQIINH
jgi:flagellar assembly factor FliW